MTTKPGRPRSFDREAALDDATEVFWRHGYEGTSMNALSRATGLNPPSIYAAFGGKRQLFDEIIARYQNVNRDNVRRILDEAATAREAITAILRRHADDYTDPAHPPGCLVISAAVNCSQASSEVEEKLRAERETAAGMLSRRIAADVDNGRLPADTDTEGVARFYAAVVQGMSTQARDGASRDTLHRIADLAVNAWPQRD